MGLFSRGCEHTAKIATLEQQIRDISLELAKMNTHILSLRNQWNAKLGAVSQKKSSTAIEVTPELQDFMNSLPEWERNELNAKLNNSENS